MSDEKKKTRKIKIKMSLAGSANRSRQAMLSIGKLKMLSGSSMPAMLKRSWTGRKRRTKTRAFLRKRFHGAAHAALHF
jgi:hypothetical protein